MRKLYDETIRKLLHTIYISCLENRVFQSLWKMADLIPIRLKENK